MKHCDELAPLSLPGGKEGIVLSRATNLTLLDAIHGGAAVRGVVRHCDDCSRGVLLVSGWREPESGFGEVAAGAVMTRFGEGIPRSFRWRGIVQVKGRMR